MASHCWLLPQSATVYEIWTLPTSLTSVHSTFLSWCSHKRAHLWTHQAHTSLRQLNPLSCSRSSRLPGFFLRGCAFGGQLKYALLRYPPWPPDLNLNLKTLHLLLCWAFFIAHHNLILSFFIIQLSQIKSILCENRHFICYLNHSIHSSCKSFGP